MYSYVSCAVNTQRETLCAYVYNNNAYTNVLMYKYDYYLSYKTRVHYTICTYYRRNRNCKKCRYFFKKNVTVDF